MPITGFFRGIVLSRRSSRLSERFDDDARHGHGVCLAVDLARLGDAGGGESGPGHGLLGLFVVQAVGVAEHPATAAQQIGEHLLAAGDLPAQAPFVELGQVLVVMAVAAELDARRVKLPDLGPGHHLFQGLALGQIPVVVAVQGAGDQKHRGGHAPALEQGPGLGVEIVVAVVKGKNHAVGRRVGGPWPGPG